MSVGLVFVVPALSVYPSSFSRRQLTNLRCFFPVLFPNFCVYTCSCRGCQESVSVYAAEGDDAGSSRSKKPFKCFFCRKPIGYSAPYVRMLDRRGGINSWNKQPRVVYLHARGETCTGTSRPAGASDSCAAGCGKSYPDDPISDMLGVGNAVHMFCVDCKYVKHALLLAEAQKFMEAERIRREASYSDTPRKPSKRSRTEEE